jgi:hypothetical protein
MSIVYKIVSDAELENVFLGTNFGVTDYRTLLCASVLKRAVGYHCGHTITMIMVELGLIGKKTHKLTKKGQKLLQEQYHDVLNVLMKNSG